MMFGWKENGRNKSEEKKSGRQTDGQKSCIALLGIENGNECVRSWKERMDEGGGGRSILGDFHLAKSPKHFFGLTK